MTAASRVLIVVSALLVGALIILSACSTPAAAPAIKAATGAQTTGPNAGPARTRLTVAGYVVPWDSRSEAATGDGVLVEVSPVWYQPTDAGTVVYASEQARLSVATISADASAHGVSVAPSISNFRDGRWDGALVAQIVADPGRRSAHVAAIVDLVRSHTWGAVDVDYESLPASSRAAYSAFVTELSAALHRVRVRLSVTVHAKTAEPGTWSGAKAQDWRRIGVAADEVRVMAYDYSYSTSRPGPIAPPSWVDEVLRLAKKLVPPGRIVVGVPTYGYDWVAGGEGKPIQWTDAQAIARDHAAPHGWDSATSSPWLRYTDDNGRQHTVWYENARSLTTKLALAKRYGIGRVVLWRLGGEDPGIWPVLRAAG